LPRILEVLKMLAISVENLSFGMGGGLLQKIDRDTLKWAMKASWGEIGDGTRDIYKDPVTDPGKRSKAGRYAVVRDGDSYAAVREEALDGRGNLLRPVYRDGKLLVDDSFTTLRARTAGHFEAAYQRDLVALAERQRTA
jgi:nicotinamide phosphoribosyltransferase